MSLKRPHFAGSPVRLANHEKAYLRHDIKTVSNVTGTPEDILQKAYAMYCESGKPNVAGNIIYVLGITQHSYGTQNTRATAMVQLLLGNIGLPGGGLNPQRGQSNVQGACDMGMLWNNITGYLGFPRRQNIPPLRTTWRWKRLSRATGPTNPSSWSACSKPGTGIKQPQKMTFAMTGCPSQTGKTIPTCLPMLPWRKDILKASFCWAENPSVAGPDASHEAKALENAEWMVCIDIFGKRNSCLLEAPWSKPGGYKNRSFSVAGSSQVRSGGYENEQLAQYSMGLEGC